MNLLRIAVPILAAVLVLALSSCSASVSKPDAAQSGGSKVEIARTEVPDDACAGRSFTVDRDDAEHVLSGRCGAVRITADGVNINLDGAESLRVEGNDVTVITSKPLGSVLTTGMRDTVNGADMSAVTMRGQDGTVLAHRVGALTTSGARNTVNWDSGVSSSDDTGVDNVFTFSGR